jgi:ribosome-binding factor A
VDVAPFPDASRLVVSVSPVDPGAPGAPDPESVLQHLQHAGGHLRCEVAAAVTRKRAPLLVYRLHGSAIGADR